MKTNKMTTEQATVILAGWLRTGIVDHPGYTVCRDVSGLMAKAVQNGRAWNWSAAEKNIHSAYQMLGADPVGTGRDWHCGNHPIQRH